MTACKQCGHEKSAHYYQWYGAIVLIMRARLCSVRGCRCETWGWPWWLWLPLAALALIPWLWWLL